MSEHDGAVEHDVADEHDVDHLVRTIETRLKAYEEELEFCSVESNQSLDEDLDDVAPRQFLAAHPSTRADAARQYARPASEQAWPSHPPAAIMLHTTTSLHGSMARLHAATARANARPGQTHDSGTAEELMTRLHALGGRVHRDSCDLEESVSLCGTSQKLSKVRTRPGQASSEAGRAGAAHGDKRRHVPSAIPEEAVSETLDILTGGADSSGEMSIEARMMNAIRPQMLLGKKELLEIYMRDSLLCNGRHAEQVNWEAVNTIHMQMLQQQSAMQSILSQMSMSGSMMGMSGSQGLSLPGNAYGYQGYNGVPMWQTGRSFHW